MILGREHDFGLFLRLRHLLTKVGRVVPSLVFWGLVLVLKKNYWCACTSAEGTKIRQKDLLMQSLLYTSIFIETYG